MSIKPHSSFRKGWNLTETLRRRQSKAKSVLGNCPLQLGKKTKSFVKRTQVLDFYQPRQELFTPSRSTSITHAYPIPMLDFPDVLVPIQFLLCVVFHVFSIFLWSFFMLFLYLGWTQCVGNVSVGSLLVLLEDIWSTYKLGTKKGTTLILQLLALPLQCRV